MNTGIWYGLAAYGLWGLFPLYWKLFGHVPALQVLAHRIAWSFVVLMLMTAGMRRHAAVWPWTLSARVAGMYAAAALVISVNWFLYIWAVNAGAVVETSLGYFMNPLVNVVLGVLVFGERLRRAQWVAVGIAGLGVLHLTRAYGSLPWIAIGLALSFGLYGAVKKKAPLGALAGLTTETAVLFVPAALFLVVLHAGGEGAFLRTGAATDMLLASGGVITVIPLLFFAAAVRRVTLSLVGILQYIAPTTQLLLGVLVFGEPFTRTQLLGFSLVWVALAIFTVDALRARRPAVVEQATPS